MSWVLSGSYPILHFFNGSTPALLMAGISYGLQSAGWSADTTLTNFTCHSPQGLSMSVQLRQASAGVTLQPYSASVTGRQHALHTCAPGWQYQIWANRCSFAVSIVNYRGWGYAGTLGSSVFFAGIPWCPPPTCNGVTDAEAGTEVWYAWSDSYNHPYWQQSGTPRISLYLASGVSQVSGSNYDGPFLEGAAAAYDAEACWNGRHCDSVIQSTGSFSAVTDGVPQILTYAGSWNPDASWNYQRSDFSLTAKPKGRDVTNLNIVMPFPFVYDPLVIWGDTFDAQPKIRGQIYDATCVSRGHPMDVPDTAEPAIHTPSTETWYWRNFTDQYYYGSLWLMTPKTAAVGNVAF